MRQLSKMFLCFAMFALLLSGTAFAKGNVLVYGFSSTLKTLDPHVTSDGTTHNIMNQMYETLVTTDDSEEQILPLLAEKWEMSEDAKTFTFHLKKGVKFHNGKVMTADDVVYTFQRATGPQGGGVKAFSMYIDPKSIKKVDDHTVTMSTTIPMGGAFLKTLCHTWASILNKDATESAGKDYGVMPVGTGRFKLGSWAFGDRTTFERFDDYHGTKAPLEKMIVRTIIEASSRTIELESGAVDIIEFPSLSDISRLKDSGFKIVQKPSVRNYFFGFDVTKAPYNDVRVRQALSMAIDRPGIAKAVFRNYCKVSKGIVTSASMPKKYESSPPLPYNPEKAKQLLKEAGFPNGFKGQMLASDRSEVTNAAVVLQNNFRKIGVEMEIKVIEWGAFLDSVRNAGHDPWISWWWGGTPAADPFFLMTTQFHSSLIGTTNRYIFKNETVDKLLDKGSSLPDGPEREAVYDQLWDIMNEQMAMVPLVEPYNMFAMDPKLEGAKFASGSISYYGKAYFKK